jgi:hypothetical protein
VPRGAFFRDKLSVILKVLAALRGEPRRMEFAAILRDAAQDARLLRMTVES